MINDLPDEVLERVLHEAAQGSASWRSVRGGLKRSSAITLPLHAGLNLAAKPWPVACRERREALQAVCRRWHAVIGRSSLFWATLRIDLSQHLRRWASVEGGPESQHATRWLDAKRGASRAIELKSHVA